MMLNDMQIALARREARKTIMRLVEDGYKVTSEKIEKHDYTQYKIKASKDGTIRELTLTTSTE